MTNYREILRLHSLGLNKTEIAASLHCARNTVAATLQRAGSCGLQWPLPDEMSDKQLAERLFPSAPGKPVYKMPDYAYVYREMQKSGVRLCVVSNSKKPRVQVFCKAYSLDCITRAKKPFQRGIRAAKEKYGIAPDHMALVGDQIYTDVLGANCGGITSILVRAIHNHNFWLRLRHVAELPFIAIGKRRIQHEKP